MKKVIERIVESPGAPTENDLWLNGTTLKKFQNGEWVTISGGGSGSGSGSGSGCTCLSQMIVKGSISDSQTGTYFNPIDNQPSLEDAIQHFISGGTVMLQEDANDVTHFMRVIEYLSQGGLQALVAYIMGGSGIVWMNANPEDLGGGDNPTPTDPGQIL